MLKMFIDNEEVVSNKEFTITEEMLATSSTILNNCYPKTWEDTKNYVNNFYFPKDYSKCKIESGDFLYGNMPIAELNISGNNLNFITNIADRFNQFQIDGKSTQETRSGKNLLYVSPEVRESHGLTITKKDDGSIVINGTSTAIVYCNINSSYTDSSKTKFFPLIKGTPYTLYVDGNMDNIKCTIRTNSQNVKLITTGFNNNIVSSTYSNETDYYAFAYLEIPSGKTFDNVVLKPMVVQGIYTEQTIGDYEQYGVMPSPDYPSEIKNVDGIRNYFDKNITKYDKSNVADSYNTVTENETGITYKTTYQDSYPNIHFKYLDLRQYVGKKISFKTDFTINENATEAICRLEYADNNLSSIKTIVSSNISGEKLSFVVPSITELGDTYYLTIMFAIGVKTTGDKILTLTNTMLTIEDSCDTYVPYGSNYLPIVNTGNSLSKTTLIDLKGNELCSIGEVKDELIIKDGKAKINKRFGKIVLNGSENWVNGASDNKNIYRITLNNIKLQNYSSNVLPVTISNYFVGDNWYNLNHKNVDNAMSSHNSNHFLEIRSTKFSTVNELKTWLSTHNTTVYYELAEPYEVDLGDYNIELFDGANNISLESEIETNLNLDYYYKNYDLLFCGFVKNSGNISLNPRYPHYCSLEILDYKAMLSEGDTLDFVLSNITIGEAIELIIDKIKDYGFIVGNINIFNKNEVIGAYSTLNKTPYDVFQYLADISGSKWFTRVIDEYTIAIDFYDPTLMPKKANIDYTENYFEENNIIDISFSFSSRDYRNKQIMLSDQVIGNIDYTENILANGYDTNYLLQSNIAVLKKVLVNGISKTIATEEEKNIGIEADFYYTIGSNTFETAEIYSSNTSIQIIYTPLVKGRETIINDDEIERIQQYGRKGVIARYENRNDALSSSELQRIGQSYIKYKGNSEVSLVIKTKDKSLYNIGDVVYFNAPIDDLKQEYMVKKKETKIITTNGYNNVFYIFELSSSFNSEKEINWFDNQRNKANGNIQSGEYIDRNIDIDNKALIIFDNLQIKEVEVENTNTLDCVLESPFIN